MDVIDLDEHRPHETGDASCSCGRTWIAVAPLGTDILRCPACERMTGGWAKVARADRIRSFADIVETRHSPPASSAASIAMALRLDAVLPPHIVVVPGAAGGVVFESPACDMLLEVNADGSCDVAEWLLARPACHCTLAPPISPTDEAIVDALMARPRPPSEPL